MNSANDITGRDHQTASADARNRLESATRLHLFHWVIILLSMVFAYAAWSYSKSSHRSQNETKFDREFDQVVELVQHRMQNYEDALWSGVGLIQSADEEVDFNHWKAYADSIHVETKYPGINGLGVIHALAEDEVPGYLAKQRKTRPGFRIHPPHNRRERYPIGYIIPVMGNEEAVGLDMAHETNRFTAANKARDTGEAQITGPITLVQDNDNTPGFLFYAPFYHRGANDDNEQMRTRFGGLVYAPFVVKKLMQGVLGKERRQVGVRLTDENSVLYDELVEAEPDFDSAPQFKRSTSVTFYGRTWEFDVWSSKSFRAATRSSQPLLILLGGLLVDGMLIFLFVTISRSSRKALSYADSMTFQLEENAKKLTENQAVMVERSNRLAKTQDQLELAVTGGNVGIWDWDIPTESVYFSRVWHEQLGEEPGSLSGLDEFRKRIHPDDVDGVMSDVQNYLYGTSEDYLCKFRMKHADGHFVWILSTGSVERDEERRPLRFVGTHNDITDLVETQQNFERINDRYESMLDLLGSMDGLWDWEIETGETKFAPGVRKMLGFEGDDAVGFPNSLEALSSRIHADDETEFWNTINKSFETQEPFVFEFRLRQKSANFIWVKVRATLRFDENGAPARLVGSIYDITTQKEAAIELETVNARLRRSNEDLEQFAYVASHDLKEPLRAIGGFVQLLDRQYSERLDERGRGYIQHSVDGVTRMSQLINDLLYYSRVSRDDSDFEMVDLKRCAEIACSELEFSVADSKAEIEIGELGKLPGIEALFVQLFQNLIGNSIKYCEGTPIIHISSTIEADHLVIRSQDNGIGIPERYRQQVFALFKRLHLREEYRGTGIGLAICLRAVERHHGTIEVEPNENAGTCFLIRLPLKVESNKEND